MSASVLVRVSEGWEIEEHRVDLTASTPIRKWGPNPLGLIMSSLETYAADRANNQPSAAETKAAQLKR